MSPEPPGSGPSPGRREWWRRWWPRRTPPAAAHVERFRDGAEWRASQAAAAATSAARRRLERRLIRRDPVFELRGYCEVCRAPSRFATSWDWAYVVDGELTPNWRDHLWCASCGLSARMRASVAAMPALCGAGPDAAIYVTERVTRLYAALAERHSRLVGSELLAGTPPGTARADGVRCEDLRALSFADASFDAVLSFEVLEHVFEYRQALAEVWRVLRPGGAFGFTVPLDPGRETTEALAERRPDGTLHTLGPAELHGDPLGDEGCVACHRFGWDLLDQLRSLGFEAVEARGFWSRELGYLGANLFLMVARRPPAGAVRTGFRG